jgi:hypothetical protein
MAADLQWVNLGGVAPLERAYRYSILPDTRKRTLAINNGGMVSLAKRTPRYVEPQMIYTAANALMSLAVEGLVVCIGFKTRCFNPSKRMES